MDIGFGKRLKSVFGNATNAEIARKIDSTEASVGFYTRGRVPDLDKLKKIAELTNCNLHWLLTGEGEQNLPPDHVAEINKMVPDTPRSVDAREILARPGILDESFMMFSGLDLENKTDEERALIKLELEHSAMILQLKLKELEIEDYKKNNRKVEYETPSHEPQN